MSNYVRKEIADMPETNHHVFITLTSAGYQIKPHENHLTINTITANGHVYLPPVAQVAGETYVVYLVDDNSLVATLVDYGDLDSLDWISSDFILAAAADNITLRSDGRKWIVVDNQIATT